MVSIYWFIISGLWFIFFGYAWSIGCGYTNSNYTNKISNRSSAEKISDLNYSNSHDFQEGDNIIFSCTVIPDPLNIANREVLESRLRKKKVFYSLDFLRGAIPLFNKRSYFIKILSFMYYKVAFLDEVYFFI